MKAMRGMDGVVRDVEGCLDWKLERVRAGVGAGSSWRYPSKREVIGLLGRCGVYGGEVGVMDSELFGEFPAWVVFKGVGVGFGELNVASYYAGDLVVRGCSYGEIGLMLFCRGVV